ncbi:arginase family protein [Methyloligella sp. 2.7D]|uniref:arginase family protein n=1 Tax=unclassified Methyloligella TaxID=2625955 RepID=UPI00157C9EC3|nr:arginase family protein [Methyloligella sp. GL2]QKP75985.1 arginase family protein [Methyloligella sp. GL2]
MLENLSIIGVPVDSEGTLAGTSRGPRVLRQLGLLDVVPHDADIGDLPVSIASTERDPVSGMKAAPEVVVLTAKTRSAIAREIGLGRMPLIVGGCCAPLIGAMAGARDVLGGVGLAYVDGHSDLYDGQTSPAGDCADMPMAFLLGRAGDLLADAMGPNGVLAPEEVAMLGYRDAYIAAPAGSLMPEDIGDSLYRRDADALRREGMASAAKAALEHLRAGPGRFWLHLDWDVLDEEQFPSSDYLMPNGLSWTELIELVRPLIGSSHLIGMSLACYNPDNDADLSDGRKIIRCLEAMFSNDGGSR